MFRDHVDKLYQEMSKMDQKLLKGPNKTQINTYLSQSIFIYCAHVMILERMIIKQVM